LKPFKGQCFCDQGHFWGFRVILTSLAPAPPRHLDFAPVLNRPAQAAFVTPPEDRPPPQAEEPANEVVMVEALPVNDFFLFKIL
jgi:hypothetical protein